MRNKTALIFGFNKYAFEIAHHVESKNYEVRVFSNLEEDIKNEEYAVEHFDLSDDWSILEGSVDIKNSIAFCVIEDGAENIFLTISLRAYFKDLTIIAIASNKENATKLSLAGATKVIPIVETTADIITNILELPISNKVLHSILFEENDLKIAQIKIEESTTIKDEEILSIDWSRYKGIIVLSVMHENMKSEFIYSSKVKHHVLTTGDTLVVVGYENDINDFKERIGSKS
jgi:Trk K+ transport system NAD-binding subunit